MPASLTYPGVYVQEARSGSRAITGVATAIAAFVGRALRGPTDEPVKISSFGEFERIFGGLWKDSGLGYAVRDYYLNGGASAVIVRLAGGASLAKADSGGLQIQASGPGEWANGYQIKISHRSGEAEQAARAAENAAGEAYDAQAQAKKAESDSKAAEQAAKASKGDSALAAEAQRKAAIAEIARKRASEAKVAHDVADAAKKQIEQVAEDIAAQQGVTVDELFNLEVLDKTGSPPEILESFPNVTVADGPRRVDLALQASQLVRMVPETLPSNRPEEVTTTLGKEGDKGTDGDPLQPSDYIDGSHTNNKTGLFSLEKTDLFTLLCLPPSDPIGDQDDSVWREAQGFCERRGAFLIVDPPAARDTVELISTWRGTMTFTHNSALYFPRIRYSDPLHDGAIGKFVPCGAIAGVMARTDANRGVWKASAGLEANIVGVSGLAVNLTDAQNGDLNPIAVNCLRTFRNAGSVIWGARTLRGNDLLADEYKYVPVRRLALFLKESLYRGTQWVVFEPNDEPLWSQIRTTLGAFMQDLFRQGAFQGRSPREAYFVKCDAETTTQYDIDRGIVNILVGFAPLKPAEFVVITIQQKTATTTSA